MALDEQWRKSTRSNTNGACVEARKSAGTVEVRDSKDLTGPTLTFTGEAWQAFARSADSLR